MLYEYSERRCYLFYLALFLFNTGLTISLDTHLMECPHLTNYLLDYHQGLILYIIEMKLETFLHLICGVAQKR